MNKKTLITILVLLGLANQASPAFGEVKKVPLSPAKSEAGNTKKPGSVNIMADTLEEGKSQNIILGTGNVKVKFEEMRIHADRIQLNTKTGIGSARGHVVIIDKKNGNKILCLYASFNVRTKQATLYDSHGTVAREFFFHGKKVSRKSKDHYTIHEGDITSCIGDNPIWKFQCSKVDAHMGSYAFLHDPSFLINNIPVLYFPYAYIPLDTKRQTGLLIPQIGQSTEDGNFVNNQFYWAINDQWDATLGLDYLSKRGIRPSAELRYFTSPTTRGRFYMEFLEDKTNNFFWRMLFDHKQRLPYDIDVTAKVDWLQGTDYNKLFSDSVDNRTKRETDSFITFTKNWASRSLILETRYHRGIQNNNGNDFGTLPQLLFRNQLQKIGKTPFFFELDSSYTDFARKQALQSSPDLTQRVDFHPQISLPLNQWPWMTLTPRVGFRETAYDHGRQDGANNYDTFLYRTIYNVDTTLEGPSFSKTYRPWGGNGPVFKHLIEPRITHTYIPDFGNVNNKIVANDGIDTIRESNRVNYSLTNRLFEKNLQGDSLSTQQLIRFEVSQSYDFLVAKEGRGARPFSDIRFDFDSHPFERLNLNFDSTVNVYDHWFDTLNTDVVVKLWKNLGFYAERRYTRNASTDILGTLRWKIRPRWELDYSSRYDETRDKFKENDVGLEYASQCWGFGLDVVKRTNFFKGSEIEDTRFLFQVSLKGIGTYGSGTKGAMGIHKRF